MSAVRLRVTCTDPGPARQWRALLETDRGPAVVGYFPSWRQALDEGCVAGRLQAAGISWAQVEPEPLQPGEWAEVTGDGTGQALPPMPEDAYPAGAVELEHLPVDAVGRSLGLYDAGDLSRPITQQDPAAMTHTEGRRDLSPDVAAYLDTLQRGGSMYGGRA